MRFTLSLQPAQHFKTHRTNYTHIFKEKKIASPHHLSYEGCMDFAAVAQARKQCDKAACVCIITE